MRWYRRALVLFAMLAVPGCDVLFGLQTFGPPHEGQQDAALDASPYTVTGTITQRYVTNAQAGVTVMYLIPPTATITVQLDDGTTPAVAYDAANGSFTFGTATLHQRYRVHVEAADINSSYESTAMTPHFGASFAARPQAERTPVTSPTGLHFQISGFTSGNTAWVASTGQWSLTPTAATTGTFDFDWANAVAAAPPIGLLASTMYGDQLFVLEMSAKTVTGFATAAVDQINGVAHTVMVPLNRPAPGCLLLDAQRSTALTRWMTAVPDLTAGNADYSVAAIPAPDMEPAGAVDLQSSVANSDFVGMAQFVDPFASLPHVATLGAHGIRKIAGPGPSAFSAAIGGRLDASISPPTTCGSSFTLASANSYGIPGELTVAQTKIASDNSPISIGATGEIEVTWDLAQSGPNDINTVSLYELTNDQGTTAPHVRDSVITATRTAHFATTRFTTGSTYAIQIVGTAGYPGAATNGDFMTVSYPFSTVTTWSHSFVAQ
ncbi:MAG TPA: hypothetical protein VFQ65_06370 [Kofleriaceae bacterium]|nr:hypothetical protein [Kofleriaceae bacterium]